MSEVTLLRVLFLCTDNYTRSVTAEFCLKNYLKIQEMHSIEVFSAGFKYTSDISQFSNVHFIRMDELGIDTSSFQRTQFEASFLNEFDVTVAMGKEHRNYILSEYGIRIPLFNEVFKQEESSVLVPPPDKEGYYLTEIINMVDYLNLAMPSFVDNLFSFRKPKIEKLNTKEKPLRS